MDNTEQEVPQSAQEPTEWRPYKSEAIRLAAARVKLLCCDFDGTFTDGMVYVDQHGVESVRCSRRDSLGINMLKRAGITVYVISKETNPVVAMRCQKMGIGCAQAVENADGKVDIMKRVAAEMGLPLSQVAYIGDDVNDLAPLKVAGLAVTVADGHQTLKEVAHYITSARGGEHAVRELCEFILTAQGRAIEY